MEGVAVLREISLTWVRLWLSYCISLEVPEHWSREKCSRTIHWVLMAGWRCFHLRGSDRIGAAVPDVLGQWQIAVSAVDHRPSKGTFEQRDSHLLYLTDWSGGNSQWCVLAFFLWFPARHAHGHGPSSFFSMDEMVSRGLRFSQKIFCSSYHIYSIV